MATVIEEAVCFIKSKKLFDKCPNAMRDRINAVRIVKSLGDHIGDHEAEKILTMIDEYKTYPLKRDGD